MMTIQEMREKKREYGYTYTQISRMTGVPASTVQKIFQGKTVSPRYETVCALERAFVSSDHSDELRETAPYGKASYRRSGVRVWTWKTILYPCLKVSNHHSVS